MNEIHAIETPSAWNDPAREKLWLYNLHYFDDLNALAAAERASWHRALIGRWIKENPPGLSNGWEPYPVSLRIVNWIKWALAGNRLEPEWLHSLAIQARWLFKRVEWHLLGNHLFVNAKALVFAGLFFEGPEAAAWLEQGMAILAKEIPEQILPDGGQFERSPMYHALALEDLLDLANLAAAYPGAIPERWHGLAASWPDAIAHMFYWLDGLCHPDGEIAFFNDAALGIAPSPEELRAYAARLHLPWLSGAAGNIHFVLRPFSAVHPLPVVGPPLPPNGVELSRRPPPPLPRTGEGSQMPLSPEGRGVGEKGNGLVHFADSGYIRVQTDSMVALLDVAPVGPDYLPGHAHADTLSFELSLFGQRVLVNSGTSRYGTSLQRIKERGTACHNTVEVDGQNSTEVWSGFRVARRAKPFDLRIEERTDGLKITCAHDGYRRLPGKPVHRREWRFSGESLEIVDTIGGGFKEARGRLFFHPSVLAEATGETGRADLGGGRVLRWRVEDALCLLVPTEYHSEFGLSEPNVCLEMRFAGPRCTIRLAWN